MLPKGQVLSALHIVSHFTLITMHDEGTIIIPILQMKKLRLREVV